MLICTENLVISDKLQGYVFLECMKESHNTLQSIILIFSIVYNYDYTVEVRNRFKGLDPIDREPDELWTEVHDIVQETGIKTIPMEKKCQKAK